MEIGETIEFLRKQKGLTIKDVCGKELSRQTFYKFVKGETSTSITNFSYILDKLCVEFDEFLLIQNGYEEKEYIKIMKSLKKLFESKNASKISKIKQYCFDNKDMNQKFLYLYYISDILLAKILDIPFEKSATLMQKYLIGVNSWTHYELVLFNNIMFVFNSEMIDAIINKSTSNLEKYVQLKGYGNENIRMLLNVCFLLLQRKELKKLRKYFNIIKEIDLSEDAIFERCSILFLEALINFINEENNAEKQIINILNVFNTSNSSNMYSMYHDCYIHVKENKNDFQMLIL